jgi:leucyl/phenylalanyl-tRNA---protein transferase
MVAAIDPDLLLSAYAIGVFPMSDGRDAPDVYWVEPKRRSILPPEQFHLSRSLRRTLRSGRFTVTRDRAFAQVIRACAERDETWINHPIEAAYLELFARGHAHSIETWQDGALVGGLYGVKLGRGFFGESMFSAQADASKVAMCFLVARLKVGGFRLLDCQFMTDHLRSLGAIEVSQQRYLELLTAALVDSTAVLPGGVVAGAAGRVASGLRGGDARRGAEEFDALDRLLPSSDVAAGTVVGAEAGCVIAQLLTHTS